jgi:hypothetical protein
LVRLIDAKGAVVAGSLSDAEGQFLLRAPTPGMYRLKAERIAYAEAWSPAIAVEGPGAVEVELSLSPAPIALSELEVTAEQVCHIRPEDGLGVSRVWEEARKALTIQDWAEQERLHRFRISQFRSLLNSDGDVLSSESSEAEGLFDRVPFRSLSAGELQAHGYVQRRYQLETGFIETEYYAPDASVLLSDPFLETHCFSLSANEGAGDLIGVAFEPVRRSGPPNIEGVLWVDRESSELRFLEFTYTPNSWKRRPLSGGHVEFDRLPDGSWVVARWAIRMPTRRGYIETGAEILGVEGR